MKVFRHDADYTLTPVSSGKAEEQPETKTDEAQRKADGADPKRPSAARALEVMNSRLGKVKGSVL